MPSKDPKKRNAASYRHYWRHRDEVLADRRVRPSIRDYYEKRNERHWRFTLWEAAHMKPEDKKFLEEMSIVSANELTSPIFIFEFNGQRRKEILNEPLPEW